MDKERTYKIAKEFNIVENVQKLENELLQVKGVVRVEFDLCGFYDNLNQVIFLTKYDIATDSKDYFNQRRELINNVLEVANNNGLKRTEDSIEDYGTHFYFVMRCNKNWSK